MIQKLSSPGVEAARGSAAACLLAQIAADQGHPFGHEYSTKISSGRMDTDRHLLTLPREAFGNSPSRLLELLSRRLELPAGWDMRLERDWMQCTHIHLGVEDNQAARVWKVYFESSQAAPGHGTEPAPAWCRIHTGYKWTAGQPDSMTVSHYDALVLPGLMPRLSFIDEVLAHQPPLRQAFNELLRDLPSHAGNPMMLRVSDENTSRLSVDVNLYPADLTLDDMKPQLRRLAQCCGLGAASFEPWLDRFAALEIGHLAAGCNARGQAFVTIYCGMAEWMD